MLNNTNGENQNHIKKTKKQKTYYATRDKNFLWTVVILITTFFTIISYINIKGLSTIHSYTLNVIFGMFAPLFYALILFVAIYKIFNLEKTFKFSVFNFSLGRLIFWYISLIAIGSMVFYTIELKGIEYNHHTAFNVIFTKWFELFKGKTEIKDPALPNLYTPGVFGTFIFAILSFAGNRSGIAIGFTVAILILALSIFIFFVSDKKLQRFSMSKKKREKNRQEQIEAKSKNIHYEINAKSEPDNSKKANVDDFVISASQPLENVDNSLDDRSNKDQVLAKNHLDDYHDNNVSETIQAESHELVEQSKIEIHPIEEADHEIQFDIIDESQQQEKDIKPIQDDEDFELDSNILEDDQILEQKSSDSNQLENDNNYPEQPKHNWKKKPRLSIVEDEDDDFFKIN
ncbi:hypothetical protein HGG64_01165 [Mycoplasma phocoeninasale]|uniref:Uncharacterized protein n=1 Tax=Mycoplasma phocoeninasale TaxID=2726117 RepID=A0A858U1J9_9MOLU|nr:hypothetical protein [Mycoplasma phocoeninasale]QJG66320.1 hypothetical protein HGG64_01165 [Mycoplasma phocoeninasale]